MPHYDFICSTCSKRFEKVIPYTSSLAGVRCPDGHHHVQRVYSVPQVVFKGSGWYSTDHRIPVNEGSPSPISNTSL